MMRANEAGGRQNPIVKNEPRKTNQCAKWAWEGDQSQTPPGYLQMGLW